MARKSDDEQGYYVVCSACQAEGPTRHTALQAVESARKAGWSVQGEFSHCPPCHHRVLRYESAFELPSAPRPL